MCKLLSAASNSGKAILVVARIEVSCEWDTREDGTYSTSHTQFERQNRTIEVVTLFVNAPNRTTVAAHSRAHCLCRMTIVFVLFFVFVYSSFSLIIFYHLVYASNRRKINKNNADNVFWRPRIRLWSVTWNRTLVASIFLLLSFVFFFECFFCFCCLSNTTTIMFVSSHVIAHTSRRRHRRSTSRLN